MSADFLLLLPLQVCPVAPGNAAKYVDQITGNVLWGVGVLFVLAIIIGIGAIVAGRLFSMPHASKVGVISVVVVFVAAIVVGRITVTGFPERDVPFGEFAPDLPIARGEELGMFHLGSTAVVFFEPRAMGRFVAEIGPTRYGAPLVQGGPA